MCSFADGNTNYTSGKNEQVVEKITARLQQNYLLFKVNSLSANPKKFQVMITAKMINPINYLTIDNVEVKPKTTVCLLGIEIYKLF